MTHQEAPAQDQPFVYSETTGNQANPSTEFKLGVDDVAAINAAMEEVADSRRAETTDRGEPEQLFAGIVPGADGSNQLLVVDKGQPTGNPEYFIRTATIKHGQASELRRERLLASDNNRVFQPRTGPVELTVPGMVIGIGTKQVGQSPDAAWVHYATVTDARTSSGKEATSLEDVFKPASDADLVEAARRELDVDRHADRYPEVKKFSTSVDRELQPIRDALDAEGLTAQDRVRLVNLGHQIMRIANENPENVHKGNIANPELAEFMAYAEDEVRAKPTEKPKGLFGRDRKALLIKTRREAAIGTAASNAEDAYNESLKQSREL